LSIFYVPGFVPVFVPVLFRLCFVDLPRTRAPGDAPGNAPATATTESTSRDAGSCNNFDGRTGACCRCSRFGGAAALPLAAAPRPPQPRPPPPPLPALCLVRGTGRRHGPRRGAATSPRAPALRILCSPAWPGKPRPPSRPTVGARTVDCRAGGWQTGRLQVAITLTHVGAGTARPHKLTVTPVRRGTRCSEARTKRGRVGGGGVAITSR